MAGPWDAFSRSEAASASSRGGGRCAPGCSTGRPGQMPQPWRWAELPGLRGALSAALLLRGSGSAP